MASFIVSCWSQCADALESRTDTGESLFLTSCRQPSQYVRATTDNGEVGGLSPPRPTSFHGLGEPFEVKAVAPKRRLLKISSINILFGFSGLPDRRESCKLLALYD